MQKDDLKKLRKNLPKGSREILAQKFELSRGYINLILTGVRENDAVLIAAVNLVSEHKKNMHEAEKFIQTL
jgi:ATP:corrinoid adenosyltransferase